MPNTELKQSIQNALKAFEGQPLAKTASALFELLGYRSEKRLALTPNNAVQFKAEFDPQSRLNVEKALMKEWQSVDFLFQITDEEIRGAIQGQSQLFTNQNVDRAVYNSYLFFAVGLKGKPYSRTQLATATREINKLFPMPVMVLFHYGQALTLAIIARRLHKRDPSRDVLEKITLIKDISTVSPHRAHIEILHDLSVGQLATAHPLGDFVELQRAWEKTLDTSELNKKFFREVADWYFWAVDRVKFPTPSPAFPVGKNADRGGASTEMSVIRLITRLIFVWFIKEKGLVPPELFDERKLKDILYFNDPQKCSYYKAILQNLFFATLNTEMGEGRRFRGRNKNPNGLDQHHGISTVYRHEDYFKVPQAALELFAGIPFLNGGLFECLDKPEEKTYIDGFSDIPKNQPVVPDDLFFGKERIVDLSAAYGDTRRSREKVGGLINIFNDYKFTIEENTPIEEEIALDPELLGKVFENLLAAYNPETGSTARKQTGSFYTPREIVNYMVDEALIAYLDSAMSLRDGALPSKQTPANNEEIASQKTLAMTDRLRHLFAYNNQAPLFNEVETLKLIEAINNLKALDPACGSGAFPMGLLHKLVFVLKKLDPDNTRWREFQISKVADFPELVTQVEDAFKDNHDDYGRKLFLIQNCIYGVDIQPIAVQIAKLRFFISLVVEQKVDDSKPNRGIQPLPNLETKFVAANTLIGLQKPEAGKETAMSFGDLLYQGKRDELTEVRKRHFSARTPATKAKYREQDKILRGELADLLKKDGWGSETAQQLAGWDPYNQNAHADFFDPEWMFGIEGGFDVVIGNPPYVKEYTFRNAFDGVRNSPYYQGKMDIWYIFACLGLDMLKRPTGVLSFIATNNWVTNSGASKFRNKIVEDSTIIRFIDFCDYKIFESAGIQTMVLITQHDDSRQEYQFDLRRIAASKATFDDVLRLLARNKGEDLLYLRPTINRKFLKDKMLVFSSDEKDSILKNISIRANFILNENSEVAQGIVAPQDSVNSASRSIIGSKFNVGDGIFVLSENELEGMKLSKNELKLIKPYFTTNELGRYYGKRSNKYWIIYTDSSFKDPAKITPFPILKRHLDQFSKVITSDNHPYGLHRSRDEYFFLGEKIICARKCAIPTFTYTDFDCYISQTFYVIKSERINLKYLIGLLNSQLMAFWLRHKGKMQGIQFQIDKEPLLQIPIITGDDLSQKKILKYVDQILAAKRVNLAADTSALEAEIDRLVYGLYGLTEDEKAIVEGKKK